MSSDSESSRQDEDVCQSSLSAVRTSEDESSTAGTKRKRIEKGGVQSPTKKMKLNLQHGAEFTSQSETESIKGEVPGHERLGSRPSLTDLKTRKDVVLERLKFLQSSFGRKHHPIAEPAKVDTAWDYLLHEMVWMADDFDRERRLKTGRAKKLVRSSIAHLRNKQEAELRREKDNEKQALIRCGRIARMVSSYWRSVEKVAIHIRNLEIEEKEQELRTKRLDKFVEKQLKLTSEVAAGLTREHRQIVIELVKEDNQWRIWGESDEAGYEAALAEEMQPKGCTLATSRVYCKMPFLLIGKLREYQHIGLDWLVTLHDKKLNGILADEMGLGKTIQTIALLAYLACERGIWGPHLIVVPTSIMLNWEMELKRWCPGFKVLTYFGTQKERKAKRVGWSKVNSFHICITSYKLIVQDQFAFRRKPWYYLILDEAQHIKNFQSMRWQVLSKFSSRRRLLLTGTPLQNDVIELWALLHFLMPHLFQSHDDFTVWFSNPFNQSFAQSTEFNMGIIQRLQSIIRPFILRRLKKDVETQLPGKFEHVVFCAMSRRQQYLYDEFLALRGNQETSEYMGIMNLLMQLRKVCNHPELFAPRFVISPLRVARLELSANARVWLKERTQDRIARKFFNFIGAESRTALAFLRSEILIPKRGLNEAAEEMSNSLDFWTHMKPVVSYRRCGQLFDSSVLNAPNVPSASLKYLKRDFASPTTIPSLDFLLKEDCAKTEFFPAKPFELDQILLLKPLYGCDLRRLLTVPEVKGEETSIMISNFFGRKTINDAHDLLADGNFPTTRTASLRRLGLIKTTEERLEEMTDLLVKFQACPPKVLCTSPIFRLSKTTAREHAFDDQLSHCESFLSSCLSWLHPCLCRRNLFFPDRFAIEHDCGKLRRLSHLLKDLQSERRRCLIFTQMAKMLDILEKFMNLHGYTYVRLDGNTKVEQRQRVVERFNRDERVFCFISSTRSGGLGLNLTGADTVIFYDTDWNPAMDKQAQDRCHRIGQTHTVHIYRLITSFTIEENILRKSLQKRKLEDLILEDGEFTTDFYEKVKVRELLEVQDEDLEAALHHVEDDEDFSALKAAKQEEQQMTQELCEMEENTGDSGVLSRFDPVTQRAVHIWNELNPDIDAPQWEEDEAEESSGEEEAASCDEDFKAAMCTEGELIFKNKRDFLRGKYIVY